MIQSSSVVEKNVRLNSTEKQCKNKHKK